MELRGGETYHKTPPRKRLWTPPMIRSPPTCSRPVIFFGGNGHRPDQSQFLRPPRVVLEGALYSTSTRPPPQPKWHDTFCPPIFWKVKVGLSKWGLKVLAHNCPQLLAIVVILRRKFPCGKGPERPQRCTIVDDCAQIAESGLQHSFERPHVDFSDIP